MYQNKKIFILGMAKSGYECAKLLASTNEVIITDQKEQPKDHIDELKKLNVQVEITTDPLELFDESFDVVIKNPGILMSHPVIEKAVELHIPVVNEMEVAYHYLPEEVKIIGVTGSNGKTTTTTLIYEMMKSMNLPVHLGGNIGYPLSSIISKIKKGDIVLLEISDHQLLNFQDFKTNISVLTNLCPTHLDFHGSYEAYKKVKQKIFAHHTKNDLAILNASNEESLKEMKNITSNIEYFAGQDAYIKNNAIYLQNEEIIKLEDIKLKGNHNYENIMAALLVIKEFGLDKNIVNKILNDFGGVEHRLEFVKKENEVSYYNDSKSTNPVSTITALKSFESPVLLILGGFERSQDFYDLKDHLKHVKHIYAIGETRERIAEFAKDMNIPCTKKEFLKEVILDIKKDVQPGDVVLLSPASASWDQYDKFESRGDEFKGLI
ncbi:MAG: UDP-N-acetylmuramoyl-L-alanine--D-glutamate ligase [Bacilli bacterium]|nr:UDP-N-acetylmuramoyl-L-alanine--D-glutamate ligase [Bacilli bacterium]